MPDYSFIADSVLLQMIANGDELAFTELYNRYKDKLYGFAFQLSGSQEEAKDLVQDVFFKIWESQKKFTGKEIFVSYLYRMIHNFAIDNMRRFSKNTLMLNSLKIGEYNKEKGTADAAILYKELEAKINRSIQNLPPRQREVYILHRDKGLKYGEIANSLGLSVSTVENHFSRALDSLRKSFDSSFELNILLPLIFFLFFS
ncbi:RNA polymerase sigma factor [Arachidicoccus sp.]|jgi:RNA polymerase sigma-70 factor (ECF subfamily)|uniref:RNA polymerase sigma factor n=1 Tax=Arachidicoccus sp. TaxID=1872624 RepID=UPI003D1CD25C